jgi:hypothetical protein
MRDELQQRFRKALEDSFGKRRLSDALRDVEDLVRLARDRGVTWSRLGDALNEVLASLTRAEITEATLRGMMRRISAQRAAESPAARPLPAPAFQAVPDGRTKRADRDASGGRIGADAAQGNRDPIGADASGAYRSAHAALIRASRSAGKA